LEEKKQTILTITIKKIRYLNTISTTTPLTTKQQNYNWKQQLHSQEGLKRKALGYF
jgi:hypothetical protein